MKRLVLGLALSLAAALPALPALAEQAASAVVDSPWARASIGTRPAAVYLTVTNSGSETITLTGISADVAAMASIHAVTTDSNGISSMGPAGDIALEPGASAVLAPGGLHGMLMKMSAPLEKGSAVPVTLLFGDGSELPVEVPVLGLGAKGPQG